MAQLGLLEYVALVGVKESLHRRARLHHVGVPLRIDVATRRGIGVEGACGALDFASEGYVYIIEISHQCVGFGSIWQN